MANLFNKSNKQTCNKTPSQILEAKYNRSINNILLVIIFTAINVVLLVTNSGSYFLFSAFVPYYLADLAMYLCGMYPLEYYYDIENPQFYDKTYFIVTVVIIAIILVGYLLCWILAKKKKFVFLIIALSLFVIDTVGMLAITGINTDMIMDIIFHGWVIVSLILGIVNYKNLKKAPKDADGQIPEANDESINQSQMQENSVGLRRADDEVKARILLEAEEAGYQIVFRRVKKVNELVVNGVVYDEYEALIEFPHTLSAVVNGHKIEAQCDETSHMYIIFDGKQLAKKIRIV